MVTIRHERTGDAAAREALLDVSYGPIRFTKASERLRKGRLPELSLVATERGRIVGTLRLWPVSIPHPNPPPASARLQHQPAKTGVSALMSSTRYAGEGKGGGALLLGPLAVDPDCRKRGIGSALVRRALREASRHGHGAVLLVGDAPYYARFGFSSEKTGALRLPGPYERHRLLAAELTPGALDGAQGLVSASGRPAPRPDLATLVAGLVRGRPIVAPRAA